MYDVVLLALGDGHDAGGCGGGGCGPGGCGGPGAAAPAPRVPVRACGDALTAAGARVEFVTACADAEIDAVLARLDGPPRSDGLPWPDPDGKTRLVVATAATGQLRAVLRRLVRRYAPPPSRRPDDLPARRTVPDLPPVGLLPLDPALGSGRSPGGGEGAAADLAALLGLPRSPTEVAGAVLGDRIRRLDLLRTDAGSVTLDGALLGGADAAGRAVPWRGLVEVDDAVLSDGTEPLLACVVANVAGYRDLAGLPLLAGADPADGRIEVAVALPVAPRSRWGRRRPRFEVRRARGRAAAVTPREVELPLVDDGVAGTLGRKRSWWIEADAWAVYVP